MKKLLLLPITALLITSCGEAPKNELEAQENIAENIEAGKVYGPVDYNDGLLAEITILEVKLAMLADLDAKDVPTEEMVAACKESQAEYDKVMIALNKIEPYGVKGEEFKEAVIELVKQTGKMFGLYNEYSSILAVPDAEWTNENAEIWDEAYNAIYDEYEIANNACIDIQDEYANLNNMRLDYTGSTAEEIYEESIENEK